MAVTAVAEAETGHEGVRLRDLRGRLQIPAPIRESIALDRAVWPLRGYGDVTGMPM